MKFSLAAALAMSAVALLTGLISSHTVFVFLWWGGVVAIGHRYVLGERRVGPGLLVFAFYCLVTMILYKTQLWTNPTYYGFSGDGGLNSVGSDDSFFYSLVAYDLPFDFPTRFAVATQHHNYADMLGLVVAVHRRIFPGLHPLDLLYVNAFGLSFLPFFVRRIYRALFAEETGERWAFGMSLVAPYILSGSLILMRDGLVAVGFAGGIYALYSRRWLLMAVMIGLAAWLRLQSGAMLVAILMVLGVFDSQLDAEHRGWRRPDSVFRVSWLLIGLLVLSLVGVQIAFGSGWWHTLFRGDFLLTYVGQKAGRDSGTSTFNTLSHLPWLVRIPTTLAFYLGSPFLAVSTVRAKGLWVPTAFLVALYGLFFPVYAGWLYRGVARIFRARHRGALVFLILFLGNLSVLTQASMQLRHKIPLHPMLYVLVAYGVATPYHQDRSLGWLATVGVLAMIVVYNFLPFLGL